MSSISITKITYVTFETQKTITVEKLFKVSQYRLIIELYKFFGWATTPLYGNLDQPKSKTDTKLYKISQNRHMVVNFLIFPGGPWPTLTHEELRHLVKWFMFKFIYVNDWKIYLSFYNQEL